MIRILFTRKVISEPTATMITDGMPMAQILDLTLVDIEPEGDTCFPAINWNDYEETERELHEGNPAYTYVTLQKK